MLLKRGIEIGKAKHDQTGCMNGKCGGWLMVKFQFACLVPVLGKSLNCIIFK